jgi:hypothetical protein
MTHSNYNGFIFFENDFYYNFFTQEFLLKGQKSMNDLYCKNKISIHSMLTKK